MCECGTSMGYRGLDGMGELVGFFDTKADAIEKWNRRTE